MLRPLYTKFSEYQASKGVVCLLFGALSVRQLIAGGAFQSNTLHLFQKRKQGEILLVEKHKNYFWNYIEEIWEASNPFEIWHPHQRRSCCSAQTYGAVHANQSTSVNLCAFHGFIQPHLILYTNSWLAGSIGEQVLHAFVAVTLLGCWLWAFSYWFETSAYNPFAAPCQGSLERIGGFRKQELFITK